MRRYLFLGLLALLPALAVRAEVIDIGNAELARLSAAGVPLIDIRTAAEWQDTGIVPGSRLLTFVDPDGRIDAPAWLARVRAIARPEQPLILICRSGSRSGSRTRAASHLLAQQAGYRTVYNVKDGVRSWAADGRPLVAAPGALATCPAGARC